MKTKEVVKEKPDKEIGISTITLMKASAEGVEVETALIELMRMIKIIVID